MNYCRHFILFHSLFILVMFHMSFESIRLPNEKKSFLLIFFIETFVSVLNTRNLWLLWNLCLLYKRNLNWIVKDHDQEDKIFRIQFILYYCLINIYIYIIFRCYFFRNESRKKTQRNLKNIITWFVAKKTRYESRKKVLTKLEFPE